MAIDLITKRLAADIGTSSRDSQAYNSTAQIQYDVTVTDPVNDDEATVQLDPQIPVVRSSHPSRPWLRCTSVNVRRVSPVLFEVTANYDSPVNSANNPDANPIDLAPQIEWTTIASEEPIDEDIHGDPIATVLGEQFDPPLTITKRDLLLRITRNVLDFDPGVIVKYTGSGGAVNSDVVLGQPPGCVHVESISARSVTDADLSYYTVTLEVAFRRGAPRTSDDKAWWRRVKAQGFLAAVLKADGKLSAMPVMKNGAPASVPALHHTATGIPLDVDATTGQYSQDAEWYEFEVYESLPFSALGIF